MYFKRIDPTALYPEFWKKCQVLQENCLKAGVAYYATSGMRTIDEQNKLYAQGRTLPGPIVTNAKGGQSFHNFGIAMDFAADKDQKRDGLQPDWSDPAYKVLGEEATKIGLEWGGVWKFKDLPHVQLPISKFGMTLLDLNKIYANGGYHALWSHLNKFKW